MEQTKTVKLPTELVARVEQVAHYSRVSFDTALTEGFAWYYGNEIPTDCDYVLASLKDLSDVQLWAVVYQRLTPEANTRLYYLADKCGETALSPRRKNRTRAPCGYCQLSNGLAC